MAPDILKALAKLSQRGMLHGRPGMIGNPHACEPEDDSQEADPVQEEAPSEAEGPQDDPGQGRADDPGGVEQGGIQSDGVHEVLPPHQFNNEGLSGQRVKSVRQAQ